METRFLFARPRPKKVNPNAGIKSLLVRCPATSKLTDTGQTIDEKLWPEATPKKQEFTCAHCGKVHSWSKKDVILARPLS